MYLLFSLIFFVCGANTAFGNVAPDSTSDVNTLRMCTEAGLQCEPCDDCLPGGWCVTDNQYSKKCICMYGWTGDDAMYLPSNPASPEWGINRIVANDCKTACHYTHHVRNLTCVTASSDPVDPPGNGCHPECTLKTGRCLPDGRCRCSRGWNGPGGKYEQKLDRYVADYCNKECQYLGYGISNDECKKEPNNVSPCNPLCRRNDGICIEDIGKCLCPLSWTGPNPQYGTGKYEGRILADYCLVQCPYTEYRRNDLCINNDYVRRLQFDGNIA